MGELVKIVQEILAGDFEGGHDERAHIDIGGRLDSDPVVVDEKDLAVGDERPGVDAGVESEDII